MTVMPQHLQALDAANKVRLARGELKQRVRTGEIKASDVLADPPPEALTMSLIVLLQAQHRWGRERALRLVKKAKVSETRRIGEMTVRQRNLIALYLEHGLEPREWWTT